MKNKCDDCMLRDKNKNCTSRLLDRETPALKNERGEVIECRHYYKRTVTT